MTTDNSDDDDDDPDYDPDYDNIVVDENEVEQDHTYYLTIPFKNPNNDQFSDGFLYDIAITPEGFFKHPLEKITNHIRDYSPNFIPDTSKLEIVKTAYCFYNNTGTSETPCRLTNVLIKTFWLKIVQRRWRNVLKKRRALFCKYLKQREYVHFSRLPGLRGCLADMR
jgi:hypothetical protein